MQSQDLNNLYIVLKDVVSKSVITNKNRAKSWRYGYDPKYDFVVISKTGEIGDIISVNGLKIALPKVPKNVYSRSKSKSEQYWQPFAYDKSLSRIKSIFQWHDAPDQFKSKWVDYIEEEFDRREEGFWFMNNGKPTYITGTHYMYYNGLRLMLVYQTFVKLTEYFIYSGRLARRTREALECAI